LVVAEIALALVLLTGACLFVRSAFEIKRIDPGFDASNLLSVRVMLPAVKYNTRERVIATYRQMIERLRAVPGVRSVEANSQIPLDGPSVDVQLHVEGRVDPPGSEPFGHFRLISPGYFASMRIPVKRGRAFTDND